MYDRLTQPRADLLNQIRPQRVERHEGSHTDFLERHQHEATLVAQAGRAARKKVAPYLFRRASDERTLRCAFDYLAAHGGQAAGPDGLCYQDLDTETAVWHFCRCLRDDLRMGVYRPGPERIVRVPKSSGRGERPIALQNIEDRVVQRAVLTILQPHLDPRFDDHSFGYRPGRGRLHALALAEKYLLKDGREVWLTQDIADAFPSVPLPRLLQLVQNYFLADDLTELVGRILEGASTRGLRQGGSLSPILLNLYLHHALDKPWRKRYPDLPLLRFADDLLVVCTSVGEARRAHDALAELLAPAGMALREPRSRAVRTLTEECPADYLGFQIDARGDSVRYRIADRAFQRLDAALRLAREEPNPEERAVQVVQAWLQQMAPAARWERLRSSTALKRVKALAQAHGFAKVLRRDRMRRIWDEAYPRWESLRWRRPRS